MGTLDTGELAKEVAFIPKVDMGWFLRSKIFKSYIYKSLDKNSKLDAEDSVDTPVVLGVVGDLSVFTPNDFTRGGDEAQFGDVDFEYCTACDDAELSVHSGAGIFLDADDVEAEGGLEFWMGDVSLLEAEAHGADEAFVFRGLSSEAFADIRDLGDHALPLLFLALSCLDDLEHLVVGDGAHLWQWYGPFATLLLAFLFQGIREYFRSRSYLTV